MQVHSDIDVFQNIPVLFFSIHHWESTDILDQLYMLIYIILYRRFEHLWILVSVGAPGTSPFRILRDNSSFGRVRSYTQISTVRGSVPLTSLLFKVNCIFFFFYNELSWEIESATLMVYLLAIISTTESKRKNQNNEPTTINQPIKSRQNQARIISSVNETLFGSLNSSCSIWQVTYVLCVLISVYVKLGW